MQNGGLCSATTTLLLFHTVSPKGIRSNVENKHENEARRSSGDTRTAQLVDHSHSLTQSINPSMDPRTDRAIDRSTHIYYHRLETVGERERERERKRQK